MWKSRGAGGRTPPLPDPVRVHVVPSSEEEGGVSRAGSPRSRYSVSQAVLSSESSAAVSSRMKFGFVWSRLIFGLVWSRLTFGLVKLKKIESFTKKMCKLYAFCAAIIRDQVFNIVTIFKMPNFLFKKNIFKNHRMGRGLTQSNNLRGAKPCRFL